MGLSMGFTDGIGAGRLREAQDFAVHVIHPVVEEAGTCGVLSSSFRSAELGLGGPGKEWSPGRKLRFQFNAPWAVVVGSCAAAPIMLALNN